jgi:hypothetical protein
MEHWQDRNYMDLNADKVAGLMEKMKLSEIEKKSIKIGGW